LTRDPAPEDTDPATTCPREVPKDGRSLPTGDADGPAAGAFALDEGDCGRRGAPVAVESPDPLSEGAVPLLVEPADPGAGPGPLGVTEAVDDELECVADPPEDSGPPTGWSPEELEGELGVSAGGADLSAALDFHDPDAAGHALVARGFTVAEAGIPPAEAAADRDRAPTEQAADAVRVLVFLPGPGSVCAGAARRAT
jgi:hypothetical protein